jgi:3'(2'), 5'-bisphosphate nucleotidase
MLNQIIKVAELAGDKILEIYTSAHFQIQNKHDESPLTIADIASNKIILENLRKISDIPIVSEEAYVEYEIRKNWDKFWLIDPLDGTKDFIAKNDEFTVNIALIEGGKPVLGIVYAPALKLMYYAQNGRGAFKNGKRIFNDSFRDDLIATDSNFHSSKETLAFLAKNRITHIKKFGSALKFGKLAEGEIDINPRFNGSKEWDTAAGHAILNEAGCKLLDLTTKNEMAYNKQDIRNNYFIALRMDLDYNYESNYISCRARD